MGRNKKNRCRVPDQLSHKATAIATPQLMSAGQLTKSCFRETQ